jgi:hypothetical protein
MLRKASIRLAVRRAFLFEARRRRALKETANQGWGRLRASRIQDLGGGAAPCSGSFKASGPLGPSFKKRGVLKRQGTQTRLGSMGQGAATGMEKLLDRLSVCNRSGAANAASLPTRIAQAAAHRDRWVSRERSRERTNSREASRAARQPQVFLAGAARAGKERKSSGRGEVRLASAESSSSSTPAAGGAAGGSTWQLNWQTSPPGGAQEASGSSAARASPPPLSSAQPPPQTGGGGLPVGLPFVRALQQAFSWTSGGGGGESTSGALQPNQLLIPATAPALPRPGSALAQASHPAVYYVPSSPETSSVHPADLDKLASSLSASIGDRLSAIEASLWNVANGQVVLSAEVEAIAGSADQTIEERFSPIALKVKQMASDVAKLAVSHEATHPAGGTSPTDTSKSTASSNAPVSAASRAKPSSPAAAKRAASVLAGGSGHVADQNAAVTAAAAAEKAANMAAEKVASVALALKDASEASEARVDAAMRVLTSGQAILRREMEEQRASIQTLLSALANSDGGGSSGSVGGGSGSGSRPLSLRGACTTPLLSKGVRARGAVKDASSKRGGACFQEQPADHSEELAQFNQQPPVWAAPPSSYSTQPRHPPSALAAKQWKSPEPDYWA